MAEPVAWQLLQRVQTDLAAIVGSGGAPYWYTPTAVYIVTTWNDPRLFDESLASPAVIYAIRRQDRTLRRMQTGDLSTGPIDHADVELNVLVSQRFNPSSPSDTPAGAQIVERMAADVLRKLAFEDPSLNDLVDDVYAQGGADDSVIEDAPAGWVTGVLNFRVAYDHAASAP